MRRILLTLGPACILVGGLIMIYAMRSEPAPAQSGRVTITNGIPTDNPPPSAASTDKPPPMPDASEALCFGQKCPPVHSLSIATAFMIAGGRDKDGIAHGLLVDEKGRVIVSPIDSDAQSGGICPDGREIVLARVGYRCAETSKLEMPR